MCEVERVEIVKSEIKMNWKIEKLVNKGNILFFQAEDGIREEIS